MYPAQETTYLHFQGHNKYTAPFLSGSSQILQQTISVETNLVPWHESSPKPTSKMLSYCSKFQREKAILKEFKKKEYIGENLHLFQSEEGV